MADAKKKKPPPKVRVRISPKQTESDLEITRRVDAVFADPEVRADQLRTARAGAAGMARIRRKGKEPKYKLALLCATLLFVAACMDPGRDAADLRPFECRHMYYSTAADAFVICRSDQSCLRPCCGGAPPPCDGGVCLPCKPDPVQCVGADMLGFCSGSYGDRHGSTVDCICL